MHHRLARRTTAGALLDVRLRDYLDAASPVVERVRPAVLHPASDYVNALVALELGRLHGLPVVYEVRGFPEVLQGRWAASRASFEKALLEARIEAECWRRADRVVTLAEVMKRHIVSHGVEPDRRGRRAQRRRCRGVQAGRAGSWPADGARDPRRGARLGLRLDAQPVRGRRRPASRRSHGSPPAGTGYAP